MGQYTGLYRVTIQEAAERLGVKEGAIRKRIERGTIRREKEIDTGRVYVYVDEPPEKKPGAEHDVEHDAGYDNGYEVSHDAGYDLLIRSQQEQIEFLRRELEGRAGELAEMRRIVAALTQRIPELPSVPSQEPRNVPETASDLHPGVEDPQGEDAGRETDKSRPWWRRLFKG